MNIKKIIFLSAILIAPLSINANEAVVSSQPIASNVGYKVLNNGGNAIDAAVAMGYALAVTFPCCGNIGGGGFMLIHLHDGTNTVLNFREVAPSHISPGLFFSNGVFQKQKTLDGFLAVGVPGTVMGLNTALEKYGTMPRQSVLQPAIDLAQNGFVLSKYDAYHLQFGAERLSKNQNVAAIFLNHGKPYQAGDLFKQPELAQTLKLISQYGSHIFYQGKIADEIVAASQKNGGVLTKSDFANFHVTWQKPITCQYHGYSIYSIPPPSAGGIALCEMLNILKPYTLLPDDIGSTHLIIEAMRNAYADRFQYLGDPKYVNNPTQYLLSEQHAQNVRNNIFLYFNKIFEDDSIPFMETPETTHYAVVDRYGNAVAVTYTLNTYFGANVIAGNTGFLLNDEMADFDIASYNKPNLSQQNQLQPGKQPLSSMTPVIMLQNNNVKYIFGAAGGITIPTQVLLAFLNTDTFGMTLQQAVAYPRYHMQANPNKLFFEPLAFTYLEQISLKALGYQMQLGSPFGTFVWGKTNAIACENNHCVSAVDPRTQDPRSFLY